MQCKCYLLVNVEDAILSIVEHEIRFTCIGFIMGDFHIFQILFKCIFDVIVDQ